MAYLTSKNHPPPYGKSHEPQQGWNVVWYTHLLSASSLLNHSAGTIKTWQMLVYPL